MLDVMESKDFFEAQAKGLRDRPNQPAWLADLQADALARFQALGWPTARVEAWRFTPIKPLIRANYGLAPHSDGTELASHILESDSLVLAFVNGSFRADLSRRNNLPEGVVLSSLAEALSGDQADLLKANLGQIAQRENEPMVALNTALCDQGILLQLADNVQLEQTVEIIHYNDGSGCFATAPRHLIVAGAGSSCSVVETYVGSAGPVFTNSVTEMLIGAEANVQHYMRNKQEQSCWHTYHLAANLQAKSKLGSHALLTGAALVRNSARITMLGEGADAYLGGLFVGKDSQIHDNHLTMDHVKGHCTSQQFFKGLLDDKARGVFTSRVIVRPDAQKTDSRQSNRNLLLSEGARVDSQPQLEIYADDVKCAHGATTGQLDEEALFYMQARGLSPENARVLLMYAFAHEVIDRMPLASLREAAESFLLERFAAGNILGGKA